jgi:hypothetical protein
MGLHRFCAVTHQKISLTITRLQMVYTIYTIKIRTLWVQGTDPKTAAMVWDGVVVYRRCTFGEGEIFFDQSEGRWIS